MDKIPGKTVLTGFEQYQETKAVRRKRMNDLDLFQAGMEFCLRITTGNGWIDAKEERPNNNRRVDVCNARTGETGDACYKGHFLGWMEQRDIKKHTIITHWREKPLPPITKD